MAKLSTGALANGPHWFGGMTRNPWNTETGSSGSSAGPGAATAAGLVGFSIGSETLGSIVGPSHTCGVTGLRPTYGRVSRYGAMALAWTMDKLGPMCRGVEDCAAVFSAIRGPDGRDRSVVDAPFNWPAATDTKALRIGYIKHEFDAMASSDDRAVYQEAFCRFEELGLRVEPVTLPAFPQGAVSMMLCVEAAAAFRQCDPGGRTGRHERCGQEFLAHGISQFSYGAGSRVSAGATGSFPDDSRHGGTDGELGRASGAR